MAKRYEKTQQNNPHQLTIKQHCFPKKSIERFANDNGLVQTRLKYVGKTVSLKPDDNNFCALRTWDQRAETGFMKEIEDAYQDLADKISEGTIVRRLTRDEKDIITDMYILWNCRWHWNKSPVENQEIEGALGVSREFSRDEEELLEKEGITIIRPNLSIRGRHFTGGKIQQNLFNVRKCMRGCNWGILKSRGAEFIVPDNASDRIFLPVTPSICLDNGEGYRMASERNVGLMNKLSKSTSERFYFGRSL